MSAEVHISPILGMTLLELFELLDIPMAVGPLIVGGAIVGTYWLQRSAQKKLDSARLVLELDKVARTEWWREMFDLIDVRAKDVGPIDLDTRLHEDMFRRFLNHLEFICTLHADGLITDMHMEVSYGNFYLLIAGNPDAHEYVIDHKKGFPALYKYMNANLYRQFGWPDLSGPSGRP